MSLQQPFTAQPRLDHVRQAIDRIDAGLIWLLGARARLVRMAAISKREAGLPLRDASREHQVHA
ncbi:MAG: chorismate mutase, partial [Dokdonella sp.]